MFLIDVLNSDGDTTTTPAGDFDLESKKDDLDIVLSLRLTPNTTVTLTTGGGQTDIPVDTEFNYPPTGAKYKLNLDETAVSAALCGDETTPVNSLSSPQLEIQLFVGNGTAAVEGAVEFGPDPADGDRVDEREWKRQP